MVKKIKTNKLVMVINILVILAWGIQNRLFFSFYTEAYFFVDKKASYIVQLLFFTTNYTTTVLLNLFLIFIVTTVTLFLILIGYIRYRQTLFQDKGKKVYLIYLICVIILAEIPLLATKIWPCVLLMIITSFTVVFITYVITEQISTEIEPSYKENTIIKQEGPFTDQDEALEQASTFIKYWEKEFSETNYSLFSTETMNENGEWFYEITVRHNKVKEV